MVQAVIVPLAWHGGILTQGGVDWSPPCRTHGQYAMYAPPAGIQLAACDGRAGTNRGVRKAQTPRYLLTDPAHLREWAPFEENRL